MAGNLSGPGAELGDISSIAFKISSLVKSKSSSLEGSLEIVKSVFGSIGLLNGVLNSKY